MSVFFALLPAYLLGSMNGSLMLGRLRGVDIRQHGSGNAGGTNALRTQGKWFALGAVLIDVAKGWVAAAWLADLPRLLAGGTAAAIPVWLAAGCGFAAVLGHVLPVWHGFRGGKGAATLVGALLALDGSLLIPLFAMWLLVVTTLGYVGLATIVAAITLPCYLLAVRAGQPPTLLLFAVSAAVLIIVTHWRNLARMLAGREPRARRLWLLGRMVR